MFLAVPSLVVSSFLHLMHLGHMLLGRFLTLFTSSLTGVFDDIACAFLGCLKLPAEDFDSDPLSLRSDPCTVLLWLSAVRFSLSPLKNKPSVTLVATIDWNAPLSLSFDVRLSLGVEAMSIAFSSDVLTRSFDLVNIGDHLGLETSMFRA